MNTTIDKTLPALLDEVGSLPPVAARIVALSTDPDCSLGDLATIIRCDPAMTLRFLALANSAALSRGHTVGTLQEALVRLGIRRTRDIALLMGMHDLIPNEKSIGVLDLVDFWKFTLATASTAQCLADKNADVAPGDAWLTGILHGIGLPLLAQQIPTAMAQAQTLARRRNLSLVAAETEILGFHQGHLAAQLLNRWNLPQGLAEAVTAGQDSAPPKSSPLAHILWLARSFVRTLGYGDCGDCNPPAKLESLPGPLAESGWDLAPLICRVGDQVQDLSQLIELDLPERTLGPALEISRQMAARIGLQGVEDSLVRSDLEADTRRAREIQRRLFPQSVPQWPGYSVAATNLPGRQVSGDTYDFPLAQDRQPLLMLADISGKGIAAALLASNLQASVRALSAVISDLGLLAATVNQTLLDTTDPEHFATMFLASLTPATGRLQYISAGHTPALRLSAAGKVDWLTAAAPPLGLLPGATYAVRELELSLGDTLVLYTDGITEATNDSWCEFGRENLLQTIKRSPATSPEALAQQIIRAVFSHCAGGTPANHILTSVGDQDDMTLVILHRFKT